MWRALKLETLVWAHMYDDTVSYADWNDGTLSMASMVSPRIEPEIVFCLARAPESSDPVAVLEATEWYALGFEIIDCVFPDWKFQPADFVAARGLHAALVVGEPVYVEPEDIGKLVDRSGGVHGAAAQEQRARRGRRERKTRSRAPRSAQVSWQRP